MPIGAHLKTLSRQHYNTRRNQDSSEQESTILEAVSIFILRIMPKCFTGFSLSNATSELIKNFGSGLKSIVFATT